MNDWQEADQMKLVTFSDNYDVQTGILSADGQNIYPWKNFNLSFTDMLDVIDRLTDADKAAVNAALSSGQAGEAIPARSVNLLAPIPCPQQDVLCLGINYFDHAKESQDFTNIAFTGEKEPAIYFSKRVNEAVAPYGSIQGHTDLDPKLDYEVELAVIIGRDALNVSETDAQNYIFGYTVINDVSARSFQSTHKQWYRGKSLDGFTPMGPCIVTSDEIAYPPNLRLQSFVNGELRQDNTSDHLVHGISELIAELSAGMTLKAGTIIATGTPSGVAMGMKEPVYLKNGDTVECRIEGIGSIINKVV